ncbi:MAG: hypothetical protein Q9219_003391 [cf. Caloplaca sp. 3 TL-2023]
MASVDHETIVPSSNVTGAVIFIAYVLAALFLTSWIVLDLYRAFRSRPQLFSNGSRRVSKQLQVVVALAVLSFSILSYHMLNYLIHSHRNWAESKAHATQPRLRPSDHRFDMSNLGSVPSLWQWLTESTLFHDFARTICQNSANFWWTLQALIVSMASALFISIEGEESESMIAFPVPDPSQIIQVPGLLSQCIPLAAYYISVASAPSSVGRPGFVSNITAIRVLLLCPYIFSVPVFRVFGSKSISVERVHSSYSASYWLGLICSLILSVQQTYVTLMEYQFGNVAAAINSDPAVSALGYDYVLYVLLFITWISFNPTAIDVSI